MQTEREREREREGDENRKPKYEFWKIITSERFSCCPFNWKNKRKKMFPFQTRDGYGQTLMLKRRVSDIFLWSLNLAT